MISNLPDISKAFSEEKTQEQILDSLQKYRKELNFLLMNLDEANMPAIAGRLDGMDGSFSLIDQQLDSITLAVGNNDGDIAALSLRADGIDLSVSNNSGDISALQITVDGIQTTVSSHDTTIGTHTSQITQLDSEISSVVSFTDVSGNDIASKINQTATTISLSASKIDLTGITTIYSGTSDSYTRMYGQGIEIVADTGQTTYTYPIEWDSYISFKLGQGIGTIFPSNVDFDGAVDFSNYVDFTGATVDGLTTTYA